MMNMTLNELLADLEKTGGLDKQAEEGKKDPEKEEKKDEKNAKGEITKAKEAVEAAGKDVDDAKSKNGDEQEQCKEARLSGAALAQEVMSKVAALQNTDSNKEPEMKKEATAAGKALADALLTKRANAGDVSTENGVAPGTVPNKNIVDNAQMVAEQSATIKPMPGSDGITNSGSINQILDGIVADALSQGATSFGQGVEAKAQNIVAAEGQVEGQAVPNQVGEEGEKAAAVSELVSQGYDFTSAVEMVKAAAEELEYEEDMQIKQAALGALMDRGVDFNTAVSMVKQANALTVMGAGAAKKGLSTGAKAAIGAGVAGAVGGAAMASKRGQEKKAAVDALIGSGVDFDKAIELVNAKATQLYGA